MVDKTLQEEIWDAHRSQDRAQHMMLISKATEVVRSREVEIGRRCRSCDASIFYAISATSQRPMPIDAIPVVNGNVIVRQGKKTTALYAKVLSKADKVDENTDLYTSHFVTCPQAEEWRKISTENADEVKEEISPPELRPGN